MYRPARILLAILSSTLSACDRSPSEQIVASDSTAVLPGLQVTGDAEAASGATWTYRSTDSGISYDLTGFIRKPSGRGPFPAVIISHGAGGSANGYARGIANVMVTWGLVCIATNYTHAGGVAAGAPGSASEPGASTANVQRARKLIDILGTLGYVDANRIAAHGHSMGAFVTTATIAAHSDLFVVASHTAGGVRPENVAGPAPGEGAVAGIRLPYQMHHGDADAVVALSADQRLAGLLNAQGTVHELNVYPGTTHNEIANHATVLARIRAWYQRHGLF